MTTLLLAAILGVLIWMGLQVHKLVGILSFLSIRWQEHKDLVETILAALNNALVPGRITHDLPDDEDEDDEDE